MIYNYLDKNIKGYNSVSLFESVRSHNVDLTTLGDNPMLPSDADLIGVHGVLRGNSSLIKQAIETGTPWMYMDNAGHYFPDMYKRVILNATAPITIRGGKRFEHNTKLESWRGGQGDYILVLPPSPPYMDTFGESASGFLNHLAHNVNIYTDRDLIIRGKPAKGRKSKPLEEQIRRAYAVISWGSAVSLEAMKLGVPTISLGWCPSKPASFELSDLETDRIKEEPNRMEVYDNLTWCSFKREELPEAFDIAVENSKHKGL